jgi:hypothetical protein
LTLTLALSLAVVGTPVRVSALAGDGTPASPLQIGTPAQLLDFKTRVDAGEINLYAELTADIDMTTGDYVGHQWSPIGTDAAYVGVFNGCGKTITLQFDGQGMDTSALSNRALFNTVGVMGMVKNLNLSVNFSNTRYAAGVALYNYGTIAYTTVRGTIGGGASGYGGIVYQNGSEIVGAVKKYGRLIHCTNYADITGGVTVGGIAGSFVGEMRACANFGDLYVTNNASPGQGGLCTPPSSVAADETFIVTDCISAGDIIKVSTSSINGGGLFGGGPLSGMKLSDNFRVSNTIVFGQLADSSSNVIGSNISDNYVNEDVARNFANIYYNSSSGAGKLFGTNSGEGTANGTDGFGSETTKALIIAKTPVEFKSAELAAALNAGRNGADAVWEYVEGKDYPTLKTAVDTGAYDPAPPLPVTAYTIASKDDLVSLASAINTAGRLWGGTVTLDADIDLAGTPWIPIRNFTGVFNGAGHTIKNMTINATAGSQDIGLFATLAADAQVRNLILQDIAIDTTASYVGAVAGQSAGVIERVAVSGSIKAGSYVGGIIGSSIPQASGTNDIIIRECAARVNIVAGSNVGGIAGFFGNVSNGLNARRNHIASDVYATGSVTGISSTGGLMGTFSHGSSVSRRSSKVVKVVKGFTRAAVVSSGTNVGLVFGSFAYAGEVDTLFYLPDTTTGRVAYNTSGTGANAPVGATTITSKIEADFSQADRASHLIADLNGTRTGNDAPWEYVEGNAHPTLKFEGAEAAAPPTTYALTVTAGANGAVSSPGGSYGAGTQVSVTATADSGYHFTNWTATGVALAPNTANPLAITMPANAVTLTANFAANTQDPPPTNAATITAGAVTGYRGATVTVPVRITGNPGFAACGFTLEYNAAALTLKKITAGELITGNGSFAADGNKVLFYNESANVMGDDVLFYATFEISESAGTGDYTITLNKASDRDFSNHTETNVSVTLSKGKVTVTDYARGDVDGDGYITSNDLQLAVQAFFGKSLSDDAIAAIDADGDGIDATDILHIAKLTVGISA